MRAVVVGATGGIGEAVCQQLAQAGGIGFLIGRNELKLQEHSQRFGWNYSVADAVDWPSLETAIGRAEETLGGLDAVIHLAGSVLLKPMHLTSFSEWRATLDTNLTSAAGVIKFAAPRMFGEGGSIVLMSSAAASIGLQNHEAIAAAKGGIEGLVTSAAATYAAKKIRVNAVAPGLTKTPMTQRIWDNPKNAEHSLSMHPLGRFGEPDEVARAILWFASPENSWVTGQVLAVDGGLSSIKTVAVR
ncbi:2,5-dichloro-2,5-cyclohexadiene-1,4-diol dehydrogenase [Pirellula sp. SH-Sr6A]|uniref:SDR family NAD(P)-dependent oxidoreductase n=1 Tax=Pirellula sp. SH-Sr6A TaxID=1632865 RepID=UPI00078B546E|nr:SDR family oxidoreductase [Pirellula sp. SH-Sr6A]AMV31985.1 2,5-dichloro-2,5-cyclohexadiene-1,4-diol dehydrogenase [Pirellula sp. SH-Sr6A]